MLMPKQADGSGQQLVTPPLDGTILPGVTRDSVLALARAWGEAEVLEANITIRDLTQVRGVASACKCTTTACGGAPPAGRCCCGRPLRA